MNSTKKILLRAQLSVSKQQDMRVVGPSLCEIHSCMINVPKIVLSGSSSYFLPITFLILFCMYLLLK
jgi:hypothetical protein